MDIVRDPMPVPFRGQTEAIVKRKKPGPVTISVEIFGDDASSARLQTFYESRLKVVSGCAEKVLNRARSPAKTVEGQLLIGARLSTSGRLEDVLFERDTVRDDEVTGCVKKIVSGWVTGSAPARQVPVKFRLQFTRPPP